LARSYTLPPLHLLWLRKTAFTLIELIIFIVIAGVFVPLAYVAFSSAIKEGGKPEAIIKARFIAEQKLEDITKNAFDNIAVSSSPYAGVPGYTGYLWRWTISYIKWSSNPPVISGSATSTYYKNIEVTVQEPEGFEFTVSTIATKRPND
jgi:type II secretory pathway pseudopilin PulG